MKNIAYPVAVTWDNKCWLLKGVGCVGNIGYHMGEQIGGCAFNNITDDKIKLFARDTKTSRHARPVQRIFEF